MSPSNKFEDDNKNPYQYRDYANVHEGEVTPTTSSLVNTNNNDSSHGNDNNEDRDPPFPAKLHYVLNEMEKDGQRHIASWLVHGRAFMIHNQSLFEKQILSLWFRQSKFASFTRQLNIYGFIRIGTGPDKGGYYHELFLRGKAFLCKGIQRIKVKGKGPRKPQSSINRPNLAAFPPMPTLSSSSSSSSSTTSTTRATQTVPPQTPTKSATLWTQQPCPVPAPTAKNKLATTTLVTAMMGNDVPAAAFIGGTIAASKVSLCESTSSTKSNVPHLIHQLQQLVPVQPLQPQLEPLPTYHELHQFWQQLRQRQLQQLQQKVSHQFGL